MKIRSLTLSLMLLTCSLNLYAVNNTPANPNPNSATPNNSVYDEAKLNIMVNRKNPKFTIKLISNPTTGYSWFLREYNKNLVKPISQSYQAGDKKLMGAPGYQVWTFQVMKEAFTVPQETHLRFIYTRPWESEVSAKQLLFHITTQGK